MKTIRIILVMFLLVFLNACGHFEQKIDNNDSVLLADSLASSKAENSWNDSIAKVKKTKLLEEFKCIVIREVLYYGINDNSNSKSTPTDKTKAEYISHLKKFGYCPCDSGNVQEVYVKLKSDQSSATTSLINEIDRLIINPPPQIVIDSADASTFEKFWGEIIFNQTELKKFKDKRESIHINDSTTKFHLFKNELCRQLKKDSVLLKKYEQAKPKPKTEIITVVKQGSLSPDSLVNIFLLWLISSVLVFGIGWFVMSRRLRKGIKKDMTNQLAQISSGQIFEKLKSNRHFNNHIKELAKAEYSELTEQKNEELFSEQNRNVQANSNNNTPASIPETVLKSKSPEPVPQAKRKKLYFGIPSSDGKFDRDAGLEQINETGSIYEFELIDDRNAVFRVIDSEQASANATGRVDRSLKPVCNYDYIPGKKKIRTRKVGQARLEGAYWVVDGKDKAEIEFV